MDDAPTQEVELPAGALSTLETSLRSSNGAGRGPRSLAQRLGVLTSLLVLGVVAAAGFLGGVQVQKRQGGTTRVATGAATAGGGGAAARAAANAATGAGTATTVVAGTGGQAGAGGGGTGRTPGSGGAGAGTGAAGAGGGGQRAGLAGGAGAAAAGQVKLVDGPNIYVTDAQGNVVKVTTSESSRFTRTGQGTIADVRPGDNVVVQGQKGADGIVVATAVADTGTAAAGG